jgi:hypothetical protein
MRGLVNKGLSKDQKMFPRRKINRLVSKDGNKKLSIIGKINPATFTVAGDTEILAHLY